MAPKLRGRAAAEAEAANQAAALQGATAGQHHFAGVATAVQAGVQLQHDATPAPIPAHVLNAPKGDTQTHLKTFKVIAKSSGLLGLTPIPGAPPGRVFVKRITPGSWANIMCLEEQDEILEVNGRPVWDMKKELFDVEMRDKRPLELLMCRVELRPNFDADKRQPGEVTVPILQRNKFAQSNYVVTAMDLEPLGFTPSSMPPGRIFVKHVDPEEWAGEVGIMVDDEILRVDNINVEEMSEDTFMKLCANHRPLRFLMGRAGKVPKETARPGYVKEPKGGFKAPIRDRTQQTIFKMIAPAEEKKLGFIPNVFPPKRMFISGVTPGDWAESVGLQVYDELLRIEGIDVTELDEERFRAFMYHVRPLQLTFGRLGPVQESPGCQIIKHVQLPRSMLPDPPVDASQVKALAEDIRERRREAERARADFRRAVDRLQPNLSDRFDQLRAAWGKYHIENVQPFGDARANVHASRHALAKQDNLDSQVDSVLTDLWKAVNDAKYPILDDEDEAPRSPNSRAASSPQHGPQHFGYPSGTYPERGGSPPGSSFRFDQHAIQAHQSPVRSAPLGFPSSPDTTMLPPARYGGHAAFSAIQGATNGNAYGSAPARPNLAAWPGRPASPQPTRSVAFGGSGAAVPRFEQGQSSRPNEDLDPFLDELDRLEVLVKRWGETEGREQYLQGKDARVHAMQRAQLLQGMRSYPEHAAAGTGSTPMAGSGPHTTEASKPVVEGLGPAGLTFEQELNRLRQEVSAVRQKTQDDLGLQRDQFLFV